MIASPVNQAKSGTLRRNLLFKFNDPCEHDLVFFL